MILNLALKTWVFPKADRDFYYNPCDERAVPRPAIEEKTAPVIPCTEQERANFDKQEKERRSAQKQRDAAQALAMIIVASPVWLYHWKMARKEV